MSNEQDGYHSAIRRLKQRWDAEDAERDQVERRRKATFLEEHASEIFAPIEDYLTKLDKVLHSIDASAVIDAAWEHSGDQQLRRAARARTTQRTQQLSLAFTIKGASILYHDRSYQFSQDTEALIRVITREIEQFIRPR